MVDPNLRTELDSAYFIVYPFGIKGYKLYVFHTNTVLISRNVIFHEQVFHCHSNQTTSLNPSYPSPTQSPILPLTIPDSDFSSSSLIHNSSYSIIAPPSISAPITETT